MHQVTEFDCNSCRLLRLLFDNMAPLDGTEGTHDCLCERAGSLDAVVLNSESQDMWSE